MTIFLFFQTFSCFEMGCFSARGGVWLTWSVDRSVKLLLALASTVILGFESHRDPRPYFSSRDLRVFECGLLFNERRDRTSKRYSPSTGGDWKEHSLMNWPSPPRKIMICYDQRLVGQSILGSSSNLGPKTRFVLLPDSCWFVDMGRPLWREDGLSFRITARKVVYRAAA
jgi:hypothetical protein